MHEVTRLRRVGGDMEHDKEMELKRERAKEHLKKKLAEFDDDVEREKGDEEFFKDRYVFNCFITVTSICS